MSADADDAADGVARLENGWGRLAVDLWRAMMAEVGGYQGVVLGAVLERSWWLPWMAKGPGGEPPDPMPVPLNLTRLAEQTGLHRPSLQEAKRRLIHDGLLTEMPDGTLLPQKDYLHGWRRSGLFVHKGRMLDYCRQGSALLDEARALRRSGLGVSGKPDTRDLRVSEKPDNRFNTLSGKPDTPEPGVSEKPDELFSTLSGKPDSDSPGVSGKPDSGCPENGTPPLISLKREREEYTTSRERASEGRAAAVMPAGCPPLPDPESGPVEVFPGRHSPSPAEIAETWRLLWSCWQDLKICYQWFERQRQHSARAWRDAIREAWRSRPDAPPHINYIDRIAANNPQGIAREIPAAPSSAPAPAPAQVIPKRPRLTPTQKERYKPLPGARMSEQIDPNILEKIRPGSVLWRLREHILEARPPAPGGPSS